MEFINNILHSIGFDWHVAIANFFNFLIVLFILNKLVFKKVLSKVEDRDRVIKEGLNNASLAETNLKNANQKAEDLLSEANKKSELNIKNSIDKANQEAKNIIDKAESNIKSLESLLKDNIKNAEEKVYSDFSKVAPSLFADFIKKTMGKLDDEAHNLIVKSIIK